ncbi:MAG TPA: aminotransferase class I/II-fold pyridoxal phosphate-dependent enzyme [Leptolyngbyaceae cyanobacterium M33_DOE_097]|uniref:Aminotransferase class I/II-fold pyridoxal phosphate-dependent enzyme n=1 Tax=Oscillatoriales cyanobacterium SpSt-418 TaxID=2282169 RepID=A0A7C3KDA5_9CYAN|nr:aminotransferase class I/II-fold pyridoxal phosphate-dependent enzyme [Leptolyngbyaceae cyanobacterium M33_DOE_097]
MYTADRVSELAIFGNSPAFQEKLHVGRPNIGDRDRLMARVNDILDRKWFSNNGAYVQEFEKKLSEYTGAKHCIAMCNGTIAVEILVRALGLTGEVIIPSFTFVATAHALQWQEITPVFCDIDPATHTLDPDQVKRLITPRTSGIMGVHVWGRPCQVEELAEIADQYNLKLAFDASHAVGCSHNGKMIGNFGEAEVFSFHATKFLNAFEGGAVVTNNDELAAKIRLMKNFGFGSGYDNVVYVGTNGKMNEISAAMGVTGLESIDTFIEQNYRNYKQYQAELANIDGVKLTAYNELEKNNYQYIILEIDSTEAGINRNELVQVLHAENVLARRYFYPGCHKMQPYQSYFPNANLLLPQTEALTEKVMSLPTGTGVTSEDISKICQIIRVAVQESHKIRQFLQNKLLEV